MKTTSRVYKADVRFERDHAEVVVVTYELPASRLERGAEFIIRSSSFDESYFSTQSDRETTFKEELRRQWNAPGIIHDASEKGEMKEIVEYLKTAFMKGAGVTVTRCERLASGASQV